MMLHKEQYEKALGRTINDDYYFTFQADLDTNIVVKAFCNAVEEEVQSMIRTIKECSKDLKNLF